MAYSVTLTNDAGSFTFQTQPFFEPSIQFQWDEKRRPPQLVSSVETWTLRDATYASATQADVTTHWQDLIDLLTDRADPVNNVVFKRDVTTVYELDDATHEIVVRSIEPKVDKATWANHLVYTIVVEAKRYYTASETADDESSVADIVDLEYNLAFEYGANGLLTKTLSGKVTTELGVSAKARAESFGLVAPGAAYGTQTNGPNRVNVSVLNVEDTEASFSSVLREFGESLPANCESYTRTVDTIREGDEIVTTVNVNVVGSSSAAIVAALDAAKPSQALTRNTRSVNYGDLTGTANYEYRTPIANTANALAGPGVYYARSSLSVRGGGVRINAELIPGFDPFMSASARTPVRVTERVTIRYRGAALQPYALSEPLFPEYMDESSTETPPTLIERASDTEADAYEWTVSREYVLPNRDLLQTKFVFDDTAKYLKQTEAAFE